MAKHWSKEEVDYLEMHYGIQTVMNISEKLGRSEEAVVAKAKRLGLGLMSAGGMVTAWHLASYMGVDKKVAYRWLKKGLKHKKKTLYKKTFYFVEISDFWKWAAQNKELINFAKMERGVLIPEPDWLNEAVIHYVDNTPKRYAEKWTPTEDKMLMSSKEKGDSFERIAEILGRTEKGVKGRYEKLIRKGIAQRKRYQVPWSEMEVKLLIDMDKQKLPDKEIAEELGREVHDIRYKRKWLRDRGMHDFRKKKLSVQVV